MRYDFCKPSANILALVLIHRGRSFPYVLCFYKSALGYHCPRSAKLPFCGTGSIFMTYTNSFSSVSVSIQWYAILSAFWSGIASIRLILQSPPKQLLYNNRRGDLEKRIQSSP
ncbi:hypothetical protein CEXT_219501 [Caerostris extrusa]|uniref:Uncharacterized protein n=1 Tax=Caerostris extrusa TaxID=172846 RepID=A0AAV4STJ0_CAEEX|nr:hypothetical protein CEXT_219501 [Caerostris extrusa]